MNIQFYVIDLETSGLKTEYHGICELSIIRASDRMQLTRQIRVNRPENASIDALRIIKKSIDDLRQGIPDSLLIEEVEEFVNQDGITPSHRCLCGHNLINFDRKFLWELWGRYRKEFPFHLFLDTMNMFRAYAKKNGLEKPKINLSDACDTMNIKKHGTAHNAKYDTQNTFLLWQKLKDHIDLLESIKHMPHKL